MESTDIVIKRNIQKSVLIKKKNFESLVLKKTWYIKKYFVRSCRFSTPLCPPPPLPAPLSLPFKNFNRATFTTYYIKKTAENFTLNGILLMLNAYFCFNKKFFLSFYCVYYNFFSDIRNITVLPNFFFLMYYRSAGLERLRNTSIDAGIKKGIWTPV